MNILKIKGNIPNPANVIPIKNTNNKAIKVPDINAASPVFNILGITNITNAPFAANITPTIRSL